MILKTNSTDEYSVTMALGIDWTQRQVIIDIRFYNNEIHKGGCYGYGASDFAQAIEKFDKLVESKGVDVIK